MFEIFLDYGLAWVSVLFGLVLSLKYLFRKLYQHDKGFKGINQVMRLIHIPLGLVLIATGLLHGLYSSVTVWSVNLGTLTWVLSILLGGCYAIRRWFRWRAVWMVLHRSLTVIFICCIVIHVIDVGGIRMFNVLFPNESIIYEVTDDSKSDNRQETTIDDKGASNSNPKTTIGDKSLAKSNDNNESTDQNSSQSSTNESKQSSSTLEDYNDGLQGVTLKDGSYTGVADGYGRDLAVSVTVKDNRIKSIVVTSHNERNEQFYGRPIALIPQEIIDNQSLSVDTVSGATFTSIGIINAVNNALSQAVISGDLPPLLELPQGRRH